MYPSAVAWLTTLMAKWQADGKSITVDGSKNTGAASYLSRMEFFDHLGLDAREFGTKPTTRD